MSHVLETGRGVLNANGYGSAAEYKTYFRARGVTVTATTSQIEAAIIKATSYIDKRFGLRFKGQPEFDNLASRSVLTFTGQPANDETIVVGSVTYTFKTTLTVPAVDTEIEIGFNLNESLTNAVATLLNSTNADLTALHNDTVSVLTIYTSKDGIGTTETIANATFDGTTSKGFSSSPQPLQFPRKNLIDDVTGLTIAGIPTELKQATFEYASRAISSSLLPDPVVDTTGRFVTEDKKVIGPIETTKKFSQFKSVDLVKPYPEADFLIGKFLKPVGRAIRA